MKLLICTQIVDRKDPALGFFTRWIEELSAHYSHITVICLQKGDYTLPPTVEVHSLGKESLKGSHLVKRLRYTLRFLRYIVRYRKNYDAAFVHMNQEYVLLGGWLWKLWGKRVYLWRNHYEGNILTALSTLFCEKVFCTSKFSYTARFKKTLIMPVGVDVESVRADIAVERVPRSILFLGRLDESKHPEVLIDALGILTRRGVSYSATIVGGPTDPHSTYPAQLDAQIKELGIASHVVRTGAVPNTETFRYYRSHEIFVNCSRSGMFDKTMFKAVASGCLVLATSRDFGALVGEEYLFTENNSEELAQKLEQFLSYSPEVRERNVAHLSQVIVKNSLPTLIGQLAKEIQ